MQSVNRRTWLLVLLLLDRSLVQLHLLGELTRLCRVSISDPCASAEVAGSQRGPQMTLDTCVEINEQV